MGIFLIMDGFILFKEINKCNSQKTVAKTLPKLHLGTLTNRPNDLFGFRLKSATFSLETFCSRIAGAWAKYYVKITDIFHSNFVNLPHIRVFLVPLVYLFSLALFYSLSI